MCIPISNYNSDKHPVTVMLTKDDEGNPWSCQCVLVATKYTRNGLISNKTVKALGREVVETGSL